jgi:nicotinamide-nucleotide amidase
MSYHTLITPTVEQLANLLLRDQLRLTTAESCTGGLIAAACTDLAGSSQWFDRGYITYSNQSKIDLLGVTDIMLETHGAVSKAVAETMAQGALLKSSASWSIAVTGIAGPTGATLDKPVGTVWAAWAEKDSKVISECYYFKGNRHDIREQTVIITISRLVKFLTESLGPVH